MRLNFAERRERRERQREGFYSAHMGAYLTLPLIFIPPSLSPSLIPSLPPSFSFLLAEHFCAILWLHLERHSSRLTSFLHPVLLLCALQHSCRSQRGSLQGEEEGEKTSAGGGGSHRGGQDGGRVGA